MTKVALNDNEMASLVKWVTERHHHVNFARPRFEIEEIPTGIGVKVIARELRSGQEEDITDYHCW